LEGDPSPAGILVINVLFNIPVPWPANGRLATKGDGRSFEIGGGPISDQNPERCELVFLRNGGLCQIKMLK
jgi:hypothetical protein